MALAGAVVQWMGFLALLGVLAFMPRIGAEPSAPGEVIILLAVSGLVLSVPSLVGLAAVRVANGRPGGRAVLWTFGPLAVALSGAMAFGAWQQMTSEGHTVGIEFMLIVLILISSALYILPIIITAFLWMLTPARTYLAWRRHEDREPLGRGLLTAAAALLAVAVFAALITAVLMTFAPRELSASGDAGHLATSLTYATIVAGVVAVMQILLLGGTVLTRLTGRWILRTIVYGAGMLILVAQMPAIVVIGLGVGAVGDESGDDVALSYAWTGIAVFSIGAILHLIAMLLIAMPSVSSLVATDGAPDDQADAGPQTY
ncbi:hypothetical protein [Actinoplanes derwentensis]|uniref:Uncharacterized protein n=1 Tax=Actinoplanes derwentensis TaxID=113562 RepID=A0A1H1TF02_9ACTN|nr:hypothetical protein [Actinoplanes derwentensis]GID89511.1 hypothetical protein Ade03nite_84350 [Actinoplanes derwentensis]SDS58862.1 hypothetical protein SAMN04489716_1122 [Actinoplanes derwentensis]